MHMRLPAAHTQLLRQLKDERSKLQDLVWELDDLEHAVADLEQHVCDTPDPTKHQELEQLRQRHDHVEDAVLYQMMYIDRLQERYDLLPYSAIPAA